jgi:hypothetical protein
MRAVTPAVCLTLTGLALAGGLASCGHPAAAPGPRTSGTAASQVPPSPRPASARPAPSAGTSTPPAAMATAPESGRATPSPSATTPSNGTALAGGLYVDAPQGIPYYILSVSLSHSAVRGSVTFLYQDGRTALITQYTGHLSGDHKLTLLFSNGRKLTGSYRHKQFSLAHCTTVLPWATPPATCQFTYHGQAAL